MSRAEVHRPRAGPSTHARARALETSTRAKSDSRRCRAPFCGDARGVGAALEKSAERTCAIEASDRGIGRAMGERDARASDAFLDAREDGNVTWNAWNRVAARDAMGARGVGRQRDRARVIGAWGYQESRVAESRGTTTRTRE